MMFLIDKINVWEILVGHWSTLKDDTDDSYTWDVVLFYGVPAAIAGACAYTGILLTSGAIDVLTNALAIMAGLLFNLLVVLQGLSAANRPRNERVRTFTREVYNNIAYAIVASLVALVPLAVAADYGDSQYFGFRLAGWIAMALVIHFALTLFMVLKRMHSMLKLEFS